MPSGVTEADVQRMTDALFIEKSWKSPSASRFWVLLVLASVIATAGVVADSTATVIGAMIVAPLMTPILGIALGAVLGDRAHLLRSIAYVVLGALAVIVIAMIIGRFNVHVDEYATNTQVAGRISPRLIDLLAALATGTVGAFALVRRDISDTLPGVAIAISLVPPLAVVGLLLEVGRFSDAAQALLLFGTNVAAIIFTGTIVLAIYRVRRVAQEAGLATTEGIGKKTIAIIVTLLVLVMLPLAIGTINVAYDQVVQVKSVPLADAWAAEAGWTVTDVTVLNKQIVVTTLGPAPGPDPAKLRRSLNDAGYTLDTLTVRQVVGGSFVCAAGGSTCTGPTSS